MSPAPLVARRLLGVHATALAALAVCLAAANWQWQRAHTVRATDARAVEFAAASPLRQYLPPASIGMTTAVEGQWVPGARLVVDRASGDGPAVLAGTATGDCPWVVDALRLADDSLVAVVRGCGSAAAAAQGSASVTGTLAPSEDADVVGLGGDAITTSRLAKQWQATVHDGYIVAAQPAAGLAPVTPLLPGPITVPLHWRNVVYVGNWLVFAGIVAYMWRRVILDELADPGAKEQM